MKKAFLKLFSNKTPKSNGLSEFFSNAPSAEKKKIIKQAVKKANEDQKELVARYNRKYSRA